MADKVVPILLQTLKPIKIIKWKVNESNSVSIGCVFLLYEVDEDDKHVICKLKSAQAGTVHKLLVQEGDVVKPGDRLLELQACTHPTVMRDMCAECGADLRKDDVITLASVPMVHSVPELKVSLEQAQKIGKADVDRLLKDRKLVLLVDLDQTLIHTTNDNIPANIKDVYHFQLYGPQSPWYHTRLRPGTHRFLENMSPYFELHICTFGARNYAHMIAMFLDQDGKLFSQRILSRDECFNPTSKTANLKALFPCGDDMVCIIDDREDVWSHAANLIHVKPYHFFQHTGDINAPPGLDKHESDEKEGVDLSKVSCDKQKVKANGLFDKDIKPQENNEISNNTEENKIIVDIKAEEKEIIENNIVVDNNAEETKIIVTNKSEEKDKIVENNAEENNLIENKVLKNNGEENDVTENKISIDSNAEKENVVIENKIIVEKINAVKDITKSNNIVENNASENKIIGKSNSDEKNNDNNHLVQENVSDKMEIEPELKSNNLDMKDNQEARTDLVKENISDKMDMEPELKSNNLDKKDNQEARTDLVQENISDKMDMEPELKSNNLDKKDNQEARTDLVQENISDKMDMEPELKSNNLDKKDNQEARTDLVQENISDKMDMEPELKSNNLDKKDNQEARTDLVQENISGKMDMEPELKSNNLDKKDNQEARTDNDNKENLPVGNINDETIKEKSNDEEITRNEDTKNENIEEKTEKVQNLYSNNEKDNESKEDELIEIEDSDDYLMYLEDILKTIHKSFYEKYDKLEAGKVPDMKKVIPEVRRNVLKDTKLVFSGLVPTHIKLELSKAYQVARSLGAKVTQDLEETTTHLVAVRPGTAKVNAGRRKKNLKIVTPDWLWACAERWTKVDESLYTLNNKGSKNRHPPPHCSSPEHNVNFDDVQDTTLRKRTPSGRFMDTINPLMSFSSADIADMDREVEDIFNESESDGESSKKTANVDEAILQKLKKDKDSDEESSSSDESLTGEHPHGWRPNENSLKRSREDQDLDDESTADEFPSTKFRRGEQLSSDLDIGQDSNSEGSVDAPDEIDDGDWNMMGAALEREFLANN